MKAYPYCEHGTERAAVMAVPKRTVRGAPGADRERVAECPSVARDDATIKLGDVNRPGVRVNRHRADRRKLLGEPSARARRRKAPGQSRSMDRPSSRNGIPVDFMRPPHRAQSVLTAAGPRFQPAGDQLAAGMRPSSWRTRLPTAPTILAAKRRRRSVCGSVRPAAKI